MRKFKDPNHLRIALEVKDTLPRSIRKIITRCNIICDYNLTEMGFSDCVGDMDNDPYKRDINETSLTCCEAYMSNSKKFRWWYIRPSVFLLNDIFELEDNKGIRDSIIHEYGHAFDFALHTRRPAAKSFHSYGNLNQLEAFAMSFCGWLSGDPDTWGVSVFMIRKFDKRLYDFFERWKEDKLWKRGIFTKKE
jgi:hypothetical protein